MKCRPIAGYRPPRDEQKRLRDKDLRHQGWIGQALAHPLQ
jgi:hypothetical protein